MKELQALLDALLAITKAASNLGVQIPNGLFRVIYDLGAHLAEDALIHHENLTEILDDLDAVFAAEQDQPAAIKSALDFAAKALAAARTALQVAGVTIKPMDVFGPAGKAIEAVVDEAKKIVG